MHEQLIGWLKNHAGVIENLDDPSTVRREQVVLPEMALLVKQFDCETNTDEKMHHEQYSKFQADYKFDVNCLVEAFEQLGNPFMERSGDLLDLDQSLIMSKKTVHNVRTIEETGKVMYISFVQNNHVTERTVHSAHTKTKSNFVQRITNGSLLKD